MKPYKMIELKAENNTPISIYQQLRGEKKFLLESAYQEGKKGNYSFIGANPYQEITGVGNKTTVLHHDKKKKEEHQLNALTYFKMHFPKLTCDFPFPFYGGAVGYVGYESSRPYMIHRSATASNEMPDIHLMIYRDIIVYDHTQDRIFLIVLNLNHQLEDVLDVRLSNLQHAILSKKSNSNQAAVPINFQPEEPKEDFIQKIKLAKRTLQEKDIRQIVLSQRLKATMTQNPFLFYQRLRKANASPYMFYIDFDDYIVLGASPECFVKTQQDTVMTNPIAGTRPRGTTENEDTLLQIELLGDKKELTEHEMLVQASKDDLLTICHQDSISIPIYKKIEKFQHVMHIVSEVHGKLKPDYSSIDAIKACLPAGTVSGYPKTQAMEKIDQIEDKRRHVYGGGIGYINFNHDVNLALAIRLLVIKHNIAHLQVGAGIVQDSIPQKEYEETLHKARSLLE